MTGRAVRPHNAGMQMTDGPGTTPPPTVRIGGGPLTPLVAIVLVMVAALALREIASLVVPVVFGLFLALVAWPLVGRLEARGSRHAVALTATLLVVLAIVVVVALVVAFSIAELVIQIPRYEDRFRALVTRPRPCSRGSASASTRRRSRRWCR